MGFSPLNCDYQCLFFVFHIFLLFLAVSVHRTREFHSCLMIQTHDLYCSHVLSQIIWDHIYDLTYGQMAMS